MIEDVSVKGSEEEVLFRPGTKFRVIARERISIGKNLI